jgi:RNA polymerase sigma-B factor
MPRCPPIQGTAAVRRTSGCNRTFESPMQRRSPQRDRTRRAYEAHLCESYLRDGDTEARDLLFEHFMPLAKKLARRYQRTGEPFEDLVQVAGLGLVKAIDRFDPERHVAFTSFAVPTILGELKRYFRDTGWALRVPRAVQEHVMALNRAVSDLSLEFGRSPSPAELAGAMGIGTEEVLEAMEAATVYDMTSLDSPVDDGDGSETRTVHVGVEDPHYEVVEYGATIAPILRELSERERRILQMRFVEDMTQSEIAEQVGISQMHVSRLLRRALAALQEANREGDALAA